MNFRQKLENKIDAALGKIPCDLVLQNANYLDVFSGEWRNTDIGIHNGTIVGTDKGIQGKRIHNAKSQWVVPGFIDAHVHIESSLLTPRGFEEIVLPKGTTTVIADPHELTNVQGTSALKYFLEQSEQMRLDVRVMLSSCVPATHMETNGGGTVSSSDLVPFLSHPKALGLAEMMNVPGVLFKDPAVMEKLEAFGGVNIDGHCPLLRGPELSAYAAAGITTCHESSELEEAREKLAKGIAVWIREGSVAKDLHTLIPLITLAACPSIGFCTDDRNPLDIAKEGHVDHLIRETLKSGVPTEVAYRMASWSVARHYGLNRGTDRRGAIAPGYLADLVILNDAKTCAIHSVLKNGVLVGESESQKDSRPTFLNSVLASVPEAKDLEGPEGNVHVIEIFPGKIITGRQVALSNAKGIAHLSVLERYGKGSKPANGYVTGFGENLNGAIASSVGHDSHNLCVVGSSTEDMRVALAALIQMGGGFVVVQKGNVLAKLPLPFGGLMTSATADQVKKDLVALRDASRRIGCALAEPFLQLAFLCLPVIPSLKLTDKGLVDVEKFEIVDVRAS